MKILFILEYYYPHIGGVETLFKSLVDRLISSGNEVTVLTNRHDSSLPKEEREEGLTIRRIPLTNRYLFTFFAVGHATRLARSHDLIHTTSYNAGIPAIIASLLTGTKSIITFHEVWLSLWFKLPWISKISAAFHYLFEYVLLKMPFDKFIGVSDFTKDALIIAGVKESRVKRIYNGIDYTSFDDLGFTRKQSDDYRFIYFGRLGISKGLNILLEATQLLNKRSDNFILTLVIPHEPKSLRMKVLKFIETHELKDRIRILSHLSYEELQREIKSADCAIIPSYSEGFCYAAVETMALGVPIISSGQGALAEVVSGQFLQFDDMSPNNLKDKMHAAITDDQWQKTEPHRFELKDSVDAYRELYQSLL